MWASLTVALSALVTAVIAGALNLREAGWKRQQKRLAGLLELRASIEKDTVEHSLLERAIWESAAELQSSTLPRRTAHKAIGIFFVVVGVGSILYSTLLVDASKRELLTVAVSLAIFAVVGISETIQRGVERRRNESLTRVADAGDRLIEHLRRVRAGDAAPPRTPSPADPT